MADEREALQLAAGVTLVTGVKKSVTGLRVEPRAAAWCLPLAWLACAASPMKCHNVLLHSPHLARPGSWSFSSHALYLSKWSQTLLKSAFSWHEFTSCQSTSCNSGRSLASPHAENNTIWSNIKVLLNQYRLVSVDLNWTTYTLLYRTVRTLNIQVKHKPPWYGPDPGTVPPDWNQCSTHYNIHMVYVL